MFYVDEYGRLVFVKTNEKGEIIQETPIPTREERIAKRKAENLERIKNGQPTYKETMVKLMGILDPKYAKKWDRHLGRLGYE